MINTNPVEITITKTDEPNMIIDELVEKLHRIHRKYNVQLVINTK